MADLYMEGDNSILDTFDNIYLGEGLRLRCTAKGLLYIHKESREGKKIGELTMDLEGYPVEFFKMEKTKDIFRKGDAFGFPHYVITNLPEECSVIVQATGPKSDKRCGMYKTTVENVIANGFILHFKDRGYERRILLKRDLFEERPH